MLLYQTNPVGVQLFSYVNTFFCHVVVPDQSCKSSTLFLCEHFLLSCCLPNQSCESSTLFLCKHFLLSCCCTKPILWEFYSFLMQTLSFVMLLYQISPVRVQLFSYSNAFCCHVVVPNQSCGSWTLLVEKLSFVPINLHDCWTRECMCSVVLVRQVIPVKSYF